MKAHSDAMRRRWADPAYRERQTAANKRAAQVWREALADPDLRARHAQALRRSRQMKRRKRWLTT